MALPPGGIDALPFGCRHGAAAQIMEESLDINTDRFPVFLIVSLNSFN
jgi:hypothetical protein